MPEFTIGWEYHEQVEAADADEARMVAHERLQRFVGERKYGVSKGMSFWIKPAEPKHVQDPSST